MFSIKNKQVIEVLLVKNDKDSPYTLPKVGCLTFFLYIFFWDLVSEFYYLKYEWWYVSSPLILVFKQLRYDTEIDEKSHKNVVKSVCYDYEEVSAAENENVDKLIESAFVDNYEPIYKVGSSFYYFYT